MAAGGECEGWERLDWERWVGRRAGDDEWAGETVHLVKVEGSVKGGRERGRSDRVSEETRVTGLDREDRAGRSEVGRVRDVLGGAEVGRHADSLERGGEGDEGGHVGVGELVRTLGDRGHVGGLQCRREEGDVRRLVLGNLLQVGVEGSAEPGRCELRLRKVGETLSVKDILEVLERQRVVENHPVNVRGLSLLDGRS